MRLRHHFRAALLAAALPCAVQAQADAQVQAVEPSGSLTVVVTHVRRAVGHVRVDVCARAEFLKNCLHGGSAPAVQGETTVTVTDLPPGRYAIQAYLDENDNGQVDQNFLGIPKEGVGFSRDAPFGLGPPSFRRAAFSHDETSDTVTLKLRYFPG